MKKQNGFTLIELVIVIIVLGILAATAVPKFINLQDDAKESALKGAEAAIHSAANIVYSKAAIDGKEKGSRDADATKGIIASENGYPSNEGIVKAVELSGFTSSVQTSGTVFTLDKTGSTTGTLCQLTYIEAADEGADYKLFYGTLAASATKPTCG